MVNPCCRVVLLIYCSPRQIEKLFRVLEGTFSSKSIGRNNHFKSEVLHTLPYSVASCNPGHITLINNNNHQCHKLSISLLTCTLKGNLICLTGDNPEGFPSIKGPIYKVLRKTHLLKNLKEPYFGMCIILKSSFNQTHADFLFVSYYF